MPFKCSVVHCHSGYSNGPSEVMFTFPKQHELRQKWVKFLNREAFTITPSSRICIQHFEEKYIIPHPLKTRLNIKLNPIPTIYPSSIPKSQQVLISPPIRKMPTVRIFQKDELPIFQSLSKCESLHDILRHIRSAIEYRDFFHSSTETDLTIYRVEIQSGVSTVMECINISSDLHVKLSFEDSLFLFQIIYPIQKVLKFVTWICLTNSPNYCRNITHNYDIEPLKDLLRLVYYCPKGKCKYSTSTLQFPLQLRYTSNAAYNLLSQYLPLPSQRLLRCVKSDSIDSIKALSKFREDGFLEMMS